MRGNNSAQYPIPHDCPGASRSRKPHDCHANTPGGWKIYDVAIEGVSLVTTYRDSFAEEARTRGIDGLVKMLTDKNTQLATQDT